MDHTDRIASTLFGKTRRAVLASVFLEPEREFRLRELARLTGISAGSIQHELKQLVAADLLTRSDKGGLVMYRVNQSCTVFDELRGLVEKTSGIENLLRNALKPAAGRIRMACIYGSIARGTNRSRSDLDLLVVGAIAFGDLMALLRPVEEKIGREISPRVFSESEFKTRLKTQDRFLTSVIEGPKVVLMGAVHDAG